MSCWSPILKSRADGYNNFTIGENVVYRCIASETGQGLFARKDLYVKILNTLPGKIKRLNDGPLIYSGGVATILLSIS
jgi:hypothetical protein